MSDYTITFFATLAPTPSAIKFSGDGDEARVQFAIPQTEIGKMIELVACANQLLELTVRIVPK